MGVVGGRGGGGEEEDRLHSRLHKCSPLSGHYSGSGEEDDGLYETETERE